MSNKVHKFYVGRVRNLLGLSQDVDRPEYTRWRSKMGKKNIVGMILALVMVATLCLDSYAIYARDLGESPEPKLENQVVKEEPGKDEKAEKVEEEAKESPGQEPVETKNLSATEENKGLEVSSEEVKQPVGEPQEEKTFTVTKELGGTVTTIGNYDKFYDAVNAMSVNDASSLFTIYVNKNVTIPANEVGGYYRTNNKIKLTSGEGGPFTLTREGERGILGIQTNSELTVENIILDGNKDGQCFFISNNGKVTIGRNATVQNFIDTDNEDGPPIYMTGGTLNILDGATIQNNSSNTQGGVIQAYNGTIVNISGGTFKNNKSNKSDGGVLAAYGTLNVTGGTFEGNNAKKIGGAIIIGSRATANIKKATFKENKASTGGAVYALNAISITDTVFEENEANWGGAIFTVSGLELNNIRFSGNKADKQGGAIYVQRGNADITDSIFSKNESESGGGAIFIAYNNNGTTSISKTSFTENVSSAFGGGIYLGINGKLEVSESEFTQNQAAYGAAISSAGAGDVNKELTNIKVDSSTFTDNLSLMGGGIFTAFPTEITKSVFKNNMAQVHPQDDKTNPHDSGVGGAIEIIDNTTTIKASSFENNFAGGSGGAIGISGVARDEDKNITTIKPNIQVEISEGTKFIGNTCGVGQGGAIFTIPYLYDIEGYETGVPEATLKEKAYKNLSTAADTVFKDNVALSGFANPPADYAKYTNLAFASNSFTEKLPNQDVAKSLLNNYDVNYKNAKLSAFFDPNGGEFTEGKNPTEIRVITEKKDTEIKLLDPPKREGYKFTGWKCSMNIPEDLLKDLPEEMLKELKEGKIYQPGDKFKLDSNYIFIAQWEKEDKPTPKPDNKPTPKPTSRGNVFFVGPAPLLNKEDHAQYLIGYQDRTFGAENKMTREEVAVMFSRLLKTPPRKGQVYPYDFSDVARDRWSITAISYMNQLGIIKGYPDGSFKPEASITRAEFAAMAARFADLKEGRKTFTDLDKDYWAYDLIQRAASAGWITGYPDGTFKPDKNITRAEVVAITNRMLDRKADQDFVDQNLGKLLQFTDLDKSYWAYYPILEATNGHDYIRHENKLDEYWKEVTGKTFVYDK